MDRLSGQEDRFALGLTGCTVAGNRAWLANGGGTAGGIQSWHTSVLDRTIVWGNCAESGLGSQIEVKQGLTSLTCCATDPDGCIGVTYGGPQVFDDPIFCSPLPCSQAPTNGGLYGVMESSPCLAENSPCGMLIGAVIGCYTPLAAPEDPDTEGSVAARRPGVSLGGPWPNPASGSLAFTVRLSQPGHARLEVLDSTGRLAGVIAEDDLAAGEHVYGWSLRDDRGGALPSGVYYLHLISLGQTASEKFIVLH